MIQNETSVGVPPIDAFYASRHDWAGFLAVVRDQYPNWVRTERTFAPGVSTQIIQGRHHQVPAGEYEVVTRKADDAKRMYGHPRRVFLWLKWNGETDATDNAV